MFSLMQEIPVFYDPFMHPNLLQHRFPYPIIMSLNLYFVATRDCINTWALIWLSKQCISHISMNKGQQIQALSEISSSC